MNPTPDTGHDPWLREALRHAPDTDLGVPAGVRDGILRAARQAAAPSGPAAPVVPWWRVLADVWLRPARLGYSGAFMALLVLGVWGVALMDPEAGQAPRRQPPQVAERHDAAALPQPASVSERRLTPADAAPRPHVPARQAEPTMPPPPVAAKAAPSADEALPRQAPTAAAAARIPEAASPAPVAVAALPAAAAPPPPPEAPVVEQRAAGPSAVAPPAPPAAEAPPSPAAGPPAALARARNAALAATSAAPRAEAAADAAVLQGRVPLGAAAAPVAADPVGLLLRRLASDPSSAEMRWAAPGSDVSHGAAQAGWLRLLQQETAGRWQPVAQPAVPEPSLQLSLRSAPLANFAFTGTPTTAWLSAGGTTYRATLSDDAAARLERLRAAW